MIDLSTNLGDGKEKALLTLLLEHIFEYYSMRRHQVAVFSDGDLDDGDELGTQIVRERNKFKLPPTVQSSAYNKKALRELSEFPISIFHVEQ